jgi:hypothetical protein
MDVAVRLLEVGNLHPRLWWDPFLTATAAVLVEGGRESPIGLTLEVSGIHGFGSEPVRLLFDVAGFGAERIAALRRTFEPARLVEMAAITVAAAGLSICGGHEIQDLALRGSAADYVVDAARHHLEVAGRSRRVDLEAGWQQKWARLRRQRPGGCYVCVCEFETLTGRLGFELLDPEEVG